MNEGDCLNTSPSRSRSDRVRAASSRSASCNRVAPRRAARSAMAKSARPRNESSSASVQVRATVSMAQSDPST